jgi:hypothetical protein
MVNAHEYYTEIRITLNGKMVKTNSLFKVVIFWGQFLEHRKGISSEDQRPILNFSPRGKL